MIPFKYILITRTNFGYFFRPLDLYIIRWCKKIGCFHKVKKEINLWRWVRYSRILTCSSMGMNRHTDIKNIVFQKTNMESFDNKRRKLLKIHFFINLRRKIIFLRAHFCVIKQSLENIVTILWKSPKRVTYSLTNTISHDHICYSMCWSHRIAHMVVIILIIVRGRDHVDHSNNLHDRPWCARILWFSLP